MSPASKSKSTEKMSAKAAKEQVKASSKLLSAPSNGGNSASASAYNPISGTFHALDAAASGSLSGSQNGRIRNIDETDEHSGSSLGAGEFDSASNNGSCSGESEDPKEKTVTNSAPRADPVPGSDNDKREKIRQKNERKHQRQKERRAQELHERCSGYLMSRKLEALAQQLVAMGFSSEQATLALIQNEGRLEESVTWLFEGGEESKQQIAANIESGVNLKIDITDELAKISEMEVKFKCTKQEVERAIVACEGDLEKAEETIKSQKQESDTPPLKVQESSEPLPGNGFNKMAVPAKIPALLSQPKGAPVVGVQQLKRDEKDFSYTKATPTGIVSQESADKNLQSLKKSQPKPEWGRLQVPSGEKRWLTASTPPSVSYSLSSSLQVPVHPAKSDPRYVMANNEVKANLQATTLKEPVTVMQRPQSLNARQNLPSTSLGISSASPPASAGWYSNGISSIDMLKAANVGLGHGMTNLGLNGSSAQQFVPNHFQSFVLGPMESGAAGWSGSWNSPRSSSSSLTMPSSLGLFTGWGQSGSSAAAPVDWSSGGSTPRDYTSIDWSLDVSLLRASGKSDRPLDTWSTMFMGSRSSRSVLNTGAYMSGLQDASLVSDRRITDRLVTDHTSSAGSHDWTSPFAGKDLLRVPRQFVTSPSL